MATRGRPPGQPKTGGRLRKSLDKGERQLVSAELAGSILTTFERLGGVDDMLSWAAANRTVFYTQVLSRLFPAPQKEDHPDVQVNVQTNIGNMSDFEAAQRIAFALAKAAYEQEQATPAIEAVRVTSARAPEPVIEPVPQPAPKIPAVSAPPPVDDMERDLNRERWAASLSLTPQERIDRELVRDTIECDISTYRGSAAEQSGYVPPSAPKPSAGERRRAVMSRRRNDLL
ncbi:MULTISPECIES: hypothetical protein [unclassified Pseudomonas]|uniref:hypothetical protein n=1 Tax=unclassified Pseudomonas TaxID=196821 RepID=UPI00224AC949|nr:MULTISPECIES: hypothetical protein [unclassified Pseudomonas]MCX2815996.1 hypothetical protein [Pseudomonas sp. DCB_E]MCX9144469.1 hypothetical protein [Pseudomonas sp. DCB_Q]